MVKFLVGVALAAMAAVATLAAVLVVGLRTKSPTILGAVRRVNKAFWNPRQMRTAGRPGAYASIVRHHGRVSGREYETPVVAVPADDGFVVVLPYGTQADWLRNVLAAGRATIVHDGSAHEVDRPGVVPIEHAAPPLTESELRSHRIMGVVEALRVSETVPPEAPSANGTGAAHGVVGT